MSNDRNLLIGILALQLNFVTRDQLSQGIHQWRQDRSVGLGQILVKQGAIDAGQHQLLEELADKHLEKHAGDVHLSIQRLSSVDARAARAIVALASDDSPEQTEVASLDTIDVELTMQVAEAPQPQCSPGRFRIIRPHARGGLGEVFVAQDTELSREVALKEIQSRFAYSPDSRERFVREAEITGNLEHPGIVPVYALGKYEDGRPFYAMRFIRGESLKEAIDAFHKKYKTQLNYGEAGLELRKLLRRLVDVCNAVEYAHSRGVLHRDLKPSNIVLGRYGETLVVDWGLAKAQGSSDESVTCSVPVTPSSGSGATPTTLGSAVGTPAYMSPEQASGKVNELSEATDVYSLGATLFHVLTGRVPIAGDSADEIVSKAKTGQIREPRELRSDIPRPLEAMCLKAMAKSATERYATPSELADDLEKWLADEPISAYREPLPMRLRRWVRRHPAIVSASAACLVLGLCAAWVAAYWQGVHAKELSNKNVELTQAKNLAETQRNRAEQRERAAIDAVKRFGDVVSDNVELKNSPKLEQLRKQLLKEPLAFFRLLREQLEVDTQPDSLERLSEAAFELANLTDDIGDKQDALIAHQESLSITERLAQNAPDSHKLQSSLAKSHSNIGVLLHQSGKTAEALTEYEQAIAINERQVQADPADIETQADLATVQNNRAMLFRDTSQLEKAIAAYNEAIAIQERVIQQDPETTKYQDGMARTHINLGLALREFGKPAEAVAAQERAIAIRTRLAEEKPSSIEFQIGLAKGYTNLGMMLTDIGKQPQALTAYEKAIAIQERLAEENPAITEYRADMSISYLNLGSLLRRSGKPDEAMIALEKASKLLERLASENPTVPFFQRNLATNLNNMGNLLRDTGKFSAALATHARALAIREQLVAQNPTLIGVQNELALSHSNISNVHRQSGKLAEALESIQKARSIQEQLTQANPSVLEFRSSLAGFYWNTGTVLDKLNQRDEALGAYEQAQKMFTELVSEKPTIAEFRNNLAQLQSNMAMHHLEGDRRAEARDLLLTAIESMKGASDIATNSRARQNLVTLYRNLFKVARALADLPLIERTQTAMVELAHANPEAAQLDSRLSEVLKGEAAKDADELIALAKRCYDLRRFMQAARLYRQVMQQYPELVSDREHEVPYRAAGCGALAESGQAYGEPVPDDATRIKIRSQVMSWLTSELKQWEEQFEHGKPDEHFQVAQAMKRWQDDEDLATLRDEKILLKLPEPERLQWQTLWQQVEGLLQRSRG